MMRYPLAIAFAITSSVAFGDAVSISHFGINSKGLGLDGTGIQIGQAEGAEIGIDAGGRSGKAMYDDAAHSASNTNQRASTTKMIVVKLCRISMYQTMRLGSQA